MSNPIYIYTKDNQQIYNKFYSQHTWDKRNSLASRYILYLTKKLLRNFDIIKIKKIIDVGCGDGSKTYNLSKIFSEARIKGIDFSEAGITRASQFYTKENDKISFGLCSAEEKNYLNEDYDLITSFYVLEHIKNWESVVDYWVKSGTKYILIFVPIGKMYKFESTEHFQHFKKDGLKEYFLSHGYQCINSFCWGFPFYHPITKITLDIKRKTIRNTMSKKPSLFLQLIYNILYLLYTRCTSKSFGGDFIGLFEKIE